MQNDILKLRKQNRLARERQNPETRDLFDRKFYNAIKTHFMFIKK